MKLFFSFSFDTLLILFFRKIFSSLDSWSIFQLDHPLLESITRPQGPERTPRLLGHLLHLSDPLLPGPSGSCDHSHGDRMTGSPGRRRRKFSRPDTPDVRVRIDDGGLREHGRKGGVLLVREAVQSERRSARGHGRRREVLIDMAECECSKLLPKLGKEDFSECQRNLKCQAKVHRAV